MTIVSDARSALQNGASTVLSTVRHNKTTRRLLPVRTQELMKQLNRRIEPRRTPRRVPIVPIAISVGLAVVGTVGGILVSRYLAAKSANDEAALREMVEAAEAAEAAGEEVVLAD